MIGIETEYGIYVEGKGAQDLVDEATFLVRACPPPAATGWDYRHEHPRRDVRGFTVAHLSVDPHDAQFEQSGRPHSTDIEVRSDRILPSGARLYNDHGHPEFSTPECTSLRELIASDRAGERVMQACAEARMQRMGEGGFVALYKNNTDFHGASYGCHESYLISRALPFEDLLHAILPFFVTRPIYAGAGKVGVENVNGGGGVAAVPFQLSQRADFFTTLASVDTLYNRPIVNTRDEPHADARRFRRFHVICGDANLAEYSTLLKCGATLLVLRLLESGWRPQGVGLRDPVTAIKQISRDQTLKWNIEREHGGTVGAVDVQRVYLAAAKERMAGLSEETDQVLAEWETVLNRLASDPLGLSDTLDWAAKRALLEEFREAEGLPWSDPTLQSLDLEYHNVDPAAGLYYGLEQEGRIRRWVTDDEIAAAVESPPPGSPRALVRGLAVAKFPENVASATWSRITLSDDGNQSTTLRLSAFQDADPIAVGQKLRAARTLTEFVSAAESLATAPPAADGAEDEA